MGNKRNFDNQNKNQTLENNFITYKGDQTNKEESRCYQSKNALGNEGPLLLCRRIQSRTTATDETGSTSSALGVISRHASSAPRPRPHIKQGSKSSSPPRPEITFRHSLSFCCGIHQLNSAPFIFSRCCQRYSPQKTIPDTEMTAMNLKDDRSSCAPIRVSPETAVNRISNNVNVTTTPHSNVDHQPAEFGTFVKVNRSLLYDNHKTKHQISIRGHTRRSSAAGSCSAGRFSRVSRGEFSESGELNKGASIASEDNAFSEGMKSLPNDTMKSMTHPATTSLVLCQVENANKSNIFNNHHRSPELGPDQALVLGTCSRQCRFSAPSSERNKEHNVDLATSNDHKHKVGLSTTNDHEHNVNLSTTNDHEHNVDISTINNQEVQLFQQWQQELIACSTPSPSPFTDTQSVPSPSSATCPVTDIVTFADTTPDSTPDILHVSRCDLPLRIQTSPSALDHSSIRDGNLTNLTSNTAGDQDCSSVQRTHDETKGDVHLDSCTLLDNHAFISHQRKHHSNKRHDPFGRLCAISESLSSFFGKEQMLTHSLVSDVSTTRINQNSKNSSHSFIPSGSTVFTKDKSNMLKHANLNNTSKQHNYFHKVKSENFHTDKESCKEQNYNRRWSLFSNTISDRTCKTQGNKHLLHQDNSSSEEDYHKIMATEAEEVKSRTHACTDPVTNILTNHSKDNPNRLFQQIRKIGCSKFLTPRADQAGNRSTSTNQTWDSSHVTAHYYSLFSSLLTPHALTSHVTGTAGVLFEHVQGRHAYLHPLQPRTERPSNKYSRQASPSSLRKPNRGRQISKRSSAPLPAVKAKSAGGNPESSGSDPRQTKSCGPSKNQACDSGQTQSPTRSIAGEAGRSSRPLGKTSSALSLKMKPHKVKKRRQIPERPKECQEYDVRGEVDDVVTKMEDMKWKADQQQELQILKDFKYPLPRLVLISSKVSWNQTLSRALRNDGSILHLIYDFDSGTFQQILDECRRQLDSYLPGCKAKSVMLVCKCGPGCLYLLKNFAVTPQKMMRQKYSSVPEFWRQLGEMISKAEPTEACIHILDGAGHQLEQVQTVMGAIAQAILPNRVSVLSVAASSSNGLDVMRLYFDYRKFLMWRSQADSKFLLPESLELVSMFCSHGSGST